MTRLRNVKTVVLLIALVAAATLAAGGILRGRRGWPWASVSSP